MPITSDEDKKREHNKKIELARQEEERLRKLQEVDTHESKSVVMDDAVILNPQATRKSDWNEILKNYKTKFPELEPKQDGTLTFPDRESADEFFTEQAKKYEFLATWSIDGQLQDDHYYSCGNGKLYKGSYAQILLGLEDSLEAESDAKMIDKLTKGIERIKGCMPKESNPTVELRGKLQDSVKNSASETEETVSSKNRTQRKR